jgi:uncharacterized protein (TIGR02118 family)
MSKKIKLIALLKSKPEMSREEFKKRWVDQHAPMPAKWKNIKGYTINIAIDEYQEIKGDLPYNGTAELYWDSLEEMQEDFATAEAKAAGADADEFTILRDHVYTEEFIIKPIN